MNLFKKLKGYISSDDWNAIFDKNEIGEVIIGVFGEILKEHGFNVPEDADYNTYVNILIMITDILDQTVEIASEIIESQREPLWDKVNDVTKRAWEWTKGKTSPYLKKADDSIRGGLRTIADKLNVPKERLIGGYDFVKGKSKVAYTYLKEKFTPSLNSSIRPWVTRRAKLGRTATPRAMAKSPRGSSKIRSA